MIKTTKVYHFPGCSIKGTARELRYIETYWPEWDNPQTQSFFAGIDIESQNRQIQYVHINGNPTNIPSFVPAQPANRKTFKEKLAMTFVDYNEQALRFLEAEIQKKANKHKLFHF